MDRDVEFGGDLLFRGRTVHALLHCGDRGSNLLGALALRAGCLIQTAQAVQNPTFDLMLGIRSQLDVA